MNEVKTYDVVEDFINIEESQIRKYSTLYSFLNKQSVSLDKYCKPYMVKIQDKFDAPTQGKKWFFKSLSHLKECLEQEYFKQFDLSEFKEDIKRAESFLNEPYEISDYDFNLFHKEIRKLEDTVLYLKRQLALKQKELNEYKELFAKVVELSKK